ncbi:MAG: thrombospondin type 3 repeat-containing protein [Deltaproteobacteria bacterium]|nr:MAG: thrombospondin type 3 repeat-containing protein [Deltaproteobacteria bacterium]
MIQDGFEAKQRIKGLTILVQNEDQAICDNEGVDLYHAISPNCDPGTQAFEDDCDFSDITILTPPPSAPTPPPPPPDADRDGVVDSQDHCPGTSRKSHVDAQGCPDDQDNDGINDAHDQCPQERGIAKYHGCPIPSASMSAGQSGSGGVSGMPASGGNTGSGGIYASGGQSGSIDSGGTSGSGGNNLGSGGISGSGGTSGTSGSSGSGGSSGSAGSAGITPSRNDRPPDPFGCQLIQEK